MGNEELLRLAIEAVVPFMILDILESGGLTEGHIREAQRHAETIASKGDLILYRSKRKGESAEAMHALCYCLAVGAFFPGGVDFIGLHFEEKTGEMKDTHEAG